MEEVRPPSFLGSPPGALVLAPKPQLQLAPNGPIHLMECPGAVADPEIGTPPIQERVQLLDSPRRPAHWTETIALLRQPVDGYCGTPFRVATSIASAPELSEIRSPGTRNPPLALSADSSLGSPPSEEQQTGLAVAPTPPAPVVPFAPAIPCHPHNGPAEHRRGRHRRSGTIDDLPRAERCWTASAKSLRPEENLDPGESPCLPP